VGRGAYAWAAALTVLVACASLGESLWFSHTLARRDESVWLKTEALHAHERVAALGNALRGNVDATYWLAESLSTHAQISESVFEQLADALLWQRPWVLSVRWAPRISDSERADFETVLAERQPGAFLFEMDAHVRHLPARKKDTYFPIHFAVPRTTNDASLGFDMSSTPERANALDIALRTRSPSMTGDVPLANRLEKHGVVLAMPVFTRSRAGGESSLRGFASLVLSTERLVASVFGKDYQVPISIEDLDAHGKSRLLYRSARSSNDESSSDSLNLKLAGRTWRVSVERTERPFAEKLAPRLVSGGGALASVLAAASILLLIARSRFMDRRLTERSEELRRTREAEEALRVVNHRLEALAESCPVGIFWCNHEPRVQYMNARLGEICSSRERWDDVPALAGAVHASDRAAYDLAWQRVTDSVSQEVWSGRVWRGPHDLRFVEIRLACLRDTSGHEIAGYVGTVVDLTADRELQTRLQMSERMASLGTLAAGIGHEVNNPLTYIMGNLEMAQSALQRFQRSQSSQDADKGLSHIKVALDGSERIRDIVQGLRVFSRSNEAEVGLVDPRECLEAALRIAMSEIRYRATIVKQLDAVPPVEANKTLLAQVFLNLLTNAAQAIAVGAADRNSITVASGMFDQATLFVDIRDTGSGIAPEAIQNIFDPFFTTKPVGQGTGLGLFIANQTVHSLRGRIGVDSRPGEGTTFRVLLPAAQRSETGKTRLALSDARRVKIAVIDDEPEIRSLMAQTLTDRHEVQCYETAALALEALARESFDLIFCDVMMPVVDGLTFYARLLREFPEQAPRVVFMSGGAFGEDVQKALVNTAQPLLEKPFSAQQITEAVARFARSRDGSPEAARTPMDRLH
jgi:signal transduction histidine kinase/ActR/RegA family two-component response regulator